MPEEGMFWLRKILFHSYARVRRPMTLGVRGAVENADGKVLLVRHTYIKGWFMPGGGVERGEPCLESLKRELEEEAGVLLTGAAELKGIYSNHRSFRNDHVLLYHVRPGEWDQGKATAFGEIAEIIWTDPLDPPDGTTRGTRQRLRELFAADATDHYWAPLT